MTVRTLPTGVGTVIDADGFRRVLCVQIGFATPQRYTDSDIAVVVGGNTYTPWIVSVGSVSVSGELALSVTLANTGNEISSVALSEGEEGHTVKVYHVYFDATGAQLTEIQITPAEAITSACSWDAGSATITIASGKANNRGGRIGRWVSRFCPDSLGDALCTYAAAGTCSYSLAGCTLLANEAHFAGFPYLPQAGDTVRLRFPEHQQINIKVATPPSSRPNYTQSFTLIPKVEMPTNPVGNRPRFRPKPAVVEPSAPRRRFGL
jgi:hypothetical protein